MCKTIVCRRKMAVKYSQEKVKCDLETQPVCGSQEAGSLNIKGSVPENPWGVLSPIWILRNTPIYLVDPSCKVGRGLNCNIVLEEGDVGASLYVQISRVQFILEKVTFINGSTVVTITDRSRNGTYVNGIKMKKDSRKVLSNNDTIALASAKNRAFVFMEMVTTNDGIPDQIKREYFVADTLGKGGYGEVRRVFEKETVQQYAMKILKTDPDDTRDKLNEVMILYKAKHSNIVKLHDLRKVDNNLFIIMELMAGGDLSKRLAESGKLPEDVTKHIFYQVSLAVHHLHKNKIIHRDIKPMNILLSSTDRFPLVKITDFGLSRFLTHSATSLTVCGTPAYSAPEIQHGAKYDYKVDVWSAGVVLFLCLSGELPFTRRRTDMTFEEQVRTGKYHLKNENWKYVSKEGIQLMKKMLIVSPELRLSMSDALNSSWISQDLQMKLRVHETINEQKHHGCSISREPETSPTLQRKKPRLR